jgi:hypothetical protein
MPENHGLILGIIGQLPGFEATSCYLSSPGV